MSTGNGNPFDPVELACLPADDPHRLQLAERLRAASAEERESWRQEWSISDRLRTFLPQVEPQNAELTQRLLAIPQQPPVAPAWKRLLHPDWRHFAACLVLAGMIALYLLWPGGSGAPVRLDDALGRSIATWAVENHQAAPALEVASSDPGSVQKVLASHDLNFPVIMLQPAAGVVLRGGGICNFGSAKAAFTQWESKGAVYTLYEFNGHDLGVPPTFLTSIQKPKSPYRVQLWPGSQGKCCWALVIENEQASNVFARYGYGT